MDSISPATTSAAGITTNNNTSPDRGILQMQQTEQQSQAEQMIFLLLQERLAQQLRPQNDLQRIWQNVMLGLPALIPSPLEMASLPGTSQTFSHPLYQHNLCAWPQCDQPCENFAVFVQHLTTAHVLDERSNQQCRAQIELVENLEHRLTKERSRLQAMMQHLHMKNTPEASTAILNSTGAPLSSNGEHSPPAAVIHPTQTVKVENPIDSKPSVSNINSLTPNEDNRPPDAKRRRINDKAALPISADIARNREFYRTQNSRPPYTYASLIRQAIMESKDCQLTLNEIYQWFTETFAFFRQNAATWKNAVRHNLSLHKCFARVEQNVKGAVWTVDDSEFYRRRPQRSHASRSTSCTPKPDNHLNLSSSATLPSPAALATAEANIISTIAAQDASRNSLDAFIKDENCSADSLCTSKSENPLSLLSNAALPVATGATDEATSNKTSVQKALEMFIKEEETSPKLVVDEES